MSLLFVETDQVEQVEQIGTNSRNNLTECLNVCALRQFVERDLLNVFFIRALGINENDLAKITSQRGVESLLCLVEMKEDNIGGSPVLPS